MTHTLFGSLLTAKTRGGYQTASSRANLISNAHSLVTSSIHRFHSPLLRGAGGVPVFADGEPTAKATMHYASSTVFPPLKGDREGLPACTGSLPTVDRRSNYTSSTRQSVVSLGFLDFLGQRSGLFRRVAAFAFVLLLGIGNMWGANGDILFSQDFTNASIVDYVGSTTTTVTHLWNEETPLNGLVGTGTNLFTSIASSIKKGDIAINSSKGGGGIDASGIFQVYARGDNSEYWSISRTSNFATNAPTAIKVTMDIYFVNGSSGSSCGVCFAIGSGFDDNLSSTTRQSISNVHSGFGIKQNTTPTLLKYATTTSLGGNPSISKETWVSITWVINNSGQTLTYDKPNGSGTTELADDKFDIWVKAKNATADEYNLVASAQDATTPTKDLQNIYIGDNGGAKQHEFRLDNLVITDLTPSTPSPSSNFKISVFNSNENTGTTGEHNFVAGSGDNEIIIENFVIPQYNATGDQKQFWVGNGGYDQQHSANEYFSWKRAYHQQNNQCTDKRTLGDPVGAIGTLHAWTNSTASNYGLCFDPKGYGLMWGQEGGTWTSVPFNATSDATVWLTDIVEISSTQISSYKYYVGLLKSDGGYAGSFRSEGDATGLSRTDNLSGMQRKTGSGDSWASGLTAGTGKFRIWVNNCEQNFYCHFIPYYRATFVNNNGSDNTYSDYKSCEETNQITFPSPTKTGYNLVGWYENDEFSGTKYDAGSTYNLTSSTGSKTFFAKWTPKTNTKYVVKHFQQKLDGTYPTDPTDTEDLTGTTGASVTPAVKSYDGFTSPTAQEVTIAADGSTVVTYNYTRKSYTLTWNLDGGSIKTAGTAAGSVKFGASLTAPIVEKTGYTSTGWNPEVPATMPASDATYKATWTENICVVPSITASQLAAANYTVGDEATALSVTASVTDGGTLSYQWYKNTSESNQGGTALENCTTATYTPSTANEGTLYYYCVVTNSKTNYTSKSTTSDVSGAITVSAPAVTYAQSIDLENGSGTIADVLSAKGYTLDASVSTDVATDVSWDKGTGKPADNGLKLKNKSGIKITFTVQKGKAVSITTGSIRCLQYKIGSNSAVALKSSNPESSGYDVVAEIPADNSNDREFVISTTNTGYNILKAINIGTANSLTIQAASTSVTTDGTTTLSKASGPGTGAITYGVYTNAECTTKCTSGASIDGTTFTGSTAGTYYVMATQKGDATYCATKSNILTITVADAPATTYTVTYKAGDGTGDDIEEQYAKNDEVTLPACTFTAPTGKEFDKWSVDNSIGDKAAGATFTMPASNVTVTATWKTKTPTPSGNVLFHYRWTGSNTMPTIGSSLTATGGTISANRVSGTDGFTAQSLTGYNSNVPNDMKMSGDGSFIKFGQRYLYFGLSLDNNGKFKTGDTLFICGSISHFLISSFVTTGTNPSGDLGTLDPGSTDTHVPNVGYFILPQVDNKDAEFSTIYLSRDGSSTYLAAVKVVRPGSTPTTHTVTIEKNEDGWGTVNKTSVTVADGTNISANGATLTIGTTNITATPTTATAEYTYGFDKWSWTESLETVTKDITATATFTRTLNKYKVSYYDGSTKLGDEDVNYGSNPANYASYQTKQGYTFDSWYSDAGLTTPVTIASEVIQSAKSYYGKWTVTPEPTPGECTELISFTMPESNPTKGDQKTTVEVTNGNGIYKLANNSTETNKGWKLYSNGNFVGVSLTSGTFAIGDKVTVNITVKPDNGSYTDLKIYSDESGSTCIGTIEAVNVVVGDNEFILSAAVSSVYVVRTSDYPQNPFVKSISVCRPGSPEPCPAPTITTQPESKSNIQIGKNDITLSITATGASTYQWYECNAEGDNMVAVSFAGTTTNTLTIAKADQTLGQKYYKCVATASCGASTPSEVAAVLFIPAEFIVKYELSSPSSTPYGITTDSKTTSSDFINTLADLSVVGTSVTSGPGKGNTGKITIEQNKNTDKYLQIGFKVAPNYYLKVLEILLQVQPVTCDDQKFEAVLSDGTRSITGTAEGIKNGKNGSLTFTYNENTHFTGDVTLKLYGWDPDNDGRSYRLVPTITIGGTVSSLPEPDLAWTTEPVNGQVGDADKAIAATSEHGTGSITYSSGNTNIATIVNGKVHYVAAGDVLIYAHVAGDGVSYHSDGKTISKQITVTGDTPTPATTYTIAFAGEGTSGMTSTTATIGTAKEITNPTRTGYDFIGWTVSSGLNTATAKYGTSASQANSITSCSNICFAENSIYFLNIASANGSVTLTANWHAECPSTMSEGGTSTYINHCESTDAFLADWDIVESNVSASINSTLHAGESGNSILLTRANSGQLTIKSKKTYANIKDMSFYTGHDYSSKQSQNITVSLIDASISATVQGGYNTLTKVTPNLTASETGYKIQILFSSLGSGNHGYYIDDISFTYGSSTPQPVPGDCHYVTYHANAADATGSTVDETAYNKDEKTATIKSCGYTRAGYNFVGWTTIEGGTTKNNDYDPEDKVTISADLDLYAVWAPKVVKVNDGDIVSLTAPVDVLIIHQGGQVTGDVTVNERIEHIRPTVGTYSNINQWYTFSVPFTPTDVTIYDKADKDAYSIDAVHGTDVDNLQAGYYYLKTLSAQTVAKDVVANWKYITTAMPEKDKPYIIYFSNEHGFGNYFEINTQVSFIAEVDKEPIIINNTATPQASENIDGFQLVANPTLHNIEVENVYVLNPATNQFELEENATIPPFECYIQATKSFTAANAIIRFIPEGSFIYTDWKGAGAAQSDKPCKFIENERLMIRYHGQLYDGTGAMLNRVK